MAMWEHASSILQAIRVEHNFSICVKSMNSWNTEHYCHF